MKSKKCRLFSFLDSIEDEEFYRLKRYIHADFFNTNDRLKTLFNAIWEAKTGKVNFVEIDHVVLYRKVFSNVKASAIDDDFSGLLKLVRRFITQEEYERDEQAQKRYLLKGLESRKAHHEFGLLMNREAKNYENGGSPMRMEYQEHYFHDLLIAKQKYIYFNIYANRRVANSLLLQEFVDSLDRFHALTKIIYLGVMKRRARILGNKFNYNNITDNEEVVRNTSATNFPLLHIHHHVNKLWDLESVEQFDICKDLLFEYSKRLSLYEQQLLFQILINFCRLQTTGTHPRKWNLRQLDLYQEFFAKGFCYTGKEDRKKQISLHHFKNYMQLLIELEHFETFKKLEKQYARQVYFKNETQRRFVAEYNEAVLYFSQFLYYSKNKRTIGQEFAYDTALRLIQNMEQELSIGAQEYPDMFYRILYEVLLLKIYFEGKVRGFGKRRSAFHKYVSSQKQLSSTFRRPYLNFANSMLQVNQLKKKPKQKDIAQLKLKIDNMPVIEREWLVERVGELG